MTRVQTKGLLTAADFPKVHPLDRVPAVPAGMDRLWADWPIPYGDWTDVEGQADKIGKVTAPDELERIKDVTARIGTPIRDGLSTMLNALRNEEASYRVRFGPHGVAATSLQTRDVIVSSQPLWLPNVPFGVRLAVLAGATLHESGHVRHDRWLAKLNGYSVAAQTQPNGWWVRSQVNGEAFMAKMINVLQDVRLEYMLGVEYPAYRELFPVTLWWVARTFPPGTVDRLPSDLAEVGNFALAALRYAEYTDWGTDPEILAERDWWIGWKYRHGGTADAHSSATARPFMDALSKAWDHIHDRGFAPKPVEEPPVQEPPVRPTEGEDDEPPEDGPEDWPTEGGDGEGKGGPCTCGCSTVAFAAPVKAGCTDSHCNCHSGSGGSGGEEPTEGGDDEPPDDDDNTPTEGGKNTETWHDETDEAGDPKGIGGNTGRASTYNGDESPTEIAPKRDGLTVAAPPVHIGDINPDNYHPTVDQWSNRTVETRHTESNVVEVEVEGSIVRVVFSKTTQNPLPPKVEVNAGDANALAAAFRSKRKSPARPQVSRGGRFSPQRAYRLRTGSTEVFTRREAPEQDRLDVHLLVDNSGSMYGRMESAIHVTATLAEAVLTAGKTRVHVWGHDTGGRGTQVYDLWDSRTGEAEQGFIGTMDAGGGNNDGRVIAALSTVIAEERHEREQSVLVVISDGAPNEHPNSVASCVAKARAAGVAVLSVAIEGGLTSVQEACYGPKAVVPWMGDWDRMARDLMDGMNAVLSD